MQYPVEVPGVRLEDMVATALTSRGISTDALDERVLEESGVLGVRTELLARGVNDEFSGGEKKRAETVQLAVLQSKFAVLDEIDSGLDVDALRDVARRVERMTNDEHLGVLAITHYARLLTELRPDHVHVLLAGRIALRGGPELADRLEANGYEGIAAEVGVDTLTVEMPEETDPFADPTIGGPMTD
jgi:Fe-S cluster assembly ATP-binding protein